MADRVGINIERWLDGQPPDYREAMINLIDALRDYIRAEDDAIKDAWNEGQITREDTDAWQRERAVLTGIKQKLESFQMNPILNGLLMWPTQRGREGKGLLEP